MPNTLIVGPYPAYRFMLAQLLSTDSHSDDIREFSDIHQMRNQRVKARDLLICCTHQHATPLLEHLHRYKRKQPDLQIVLLTEQLGSRHRFCLNRGVVDLVLPMAIAPNDAAFYINALKSSDNPDFGTQALREIQRKTGFQPDLDDLTRGERRVLQQLHKGLSNQSIAEQLAITINTVKVHIQQICRKTGVQNRTQVACLFQPTLASGQ